MMKTNFEKYLQVLIMVLMMFLGAIKTNKKQLN